MQHRDESGSETQLVALGNSPLCAVIDAIDADLARSRRWRLDRDGYARSTYVAGQHQLLHRLIADAPAGMFVDHLDRDRLNCTRLNLRVVSPAESTLNKGRRPGSSRFRGVAWSPKAGKWQVYLNRRYLGLFEREIDAGWAWVKAAHAAYGHQNIAPDIRALELAGAMP